MKIPIFQIKINDGRREADQEAVHKLADSITKIGLLNPITIDQDYNLIAGLHRLEAAKLLGWTEIESNVSSLEGLMAELAEIDENLIRCELNFVDESEQLARRKDLYEMLYPETKRGAKNQYTKNAQMQLTLCQLAKNPLLTIQRKPWESVHARYPAKSNWQKTFLLKQRILLNLAELESKTH